MLERGDDGWEQDLDEMEEPEVEAAEMAIEELCTGSSCDSVPATNLLQIRVGIFTIYTSQCATTDLNKRFLPKPMTTTG